MSAVVPRPASRSWSASSPVAERSASCSQFRPAPAATYRPFTCCACAGIAATGSASTLAASRALRKVISGNSVSSVIVLGGERLRASRRNRGW
jgi:hypothetical protein